jgi:hypothetical protein
MIHTSIVLFAVLSVGQAPPFSGSPTDQPAEKKEETGTATEKKGPPFSDGPAQGASAQKPPERTWTVKAGEMAFTVGMKPGIPDPDVVTTIVIAAAQMPKTPHPRYGNRVPLEAASLTVEISSPGGEVIGKFKAHEMPLSSGKYGLHFTPAQEGIYTLAIRGTSANGKELSANIKLPVKVWPLPAELQGSGDDADKGGGRRPVKLN